MQSRRTLLIGLSSLALVAACAPRSKFRSYNGPPVTKIEVHKGARKMYLLHGTEVLKSYDIGLGFAPDGHKAFEGDGKTPEGLYYIDRRNPNSNFHLSLGISYPNEQDRAWAKAHGKSAGGDIFIHGRDGKHLLHGPRRDWTEGCIAVTDREIEDVYAMVKIGTPILILP
jgi:murein L,D-transpeptidase YafK